MITWLLGGMGVMLILFMVTLVVVLTKLRIMVRLYMLGKGGK